MWDVLSADFDQTITKERCLKKVSNIKPGDNVFHDSVKALKPRIHTTTSIGLYRCGFLGHEVI
jgi:hypothetical protein